MRLRIIEFIVMWTMLEQECCMTLTSEGVMRNFVTNYDIGIGLLPGAILACFKSGQV